MTDLASLAQPRIALVCGEFERTLAKLSVVSFAGKFEANAIPSASLTLAASTPDPTGLEALNADLASTRPGQPVTVAISTGGELFHGLVMRQQIDWSQEWPQVTLHLGHALARLPIAPRSEVFRDCLDSEVVAEKLARAQVPVEAAQGLTQAHLQLVQLRQSDWAFVAQRVKANGCWLLPGRRGVTIDAPSLEHEPRHIISRSSSKRGQFQVESVNWEYRAQPRSVEVASWDIELQEMSPLAKAREPRLGSGAFDASALDSLDRAKSETAFRSFPVSPSRRQDLADAGLLAQRLAGVQCRIMLAGTTLIDLGASVHLEDFGPQLDGNGIVSGVSQFFSKGRWRTELHIGQPFVRDTDPAFRTGGAALVTGTIDSPAQDPEGLERIAVKLPSWPNAPVLWARWATPFASKDSGLCLYPSQGDEVVLAFFEGDPAQPVILGSMFSPRNLPPLPFNEEATLRGLVIGGSAAGMRLLFQPEDGAVELGNGPNALRFEEATVTLRAPDAELGIEAASFTATADSIDLDAA